MKVGEEWEAAKVNGERKIGSRGEELILMR